ncbi:hypothetical protein DNFV4_00080 [Nitrospira tepida]|uniref:Uncharacterized protein n=1 Tax=Nitrospira tepida TaxID=2973512 RepID=A0AA86JY48_9BACT|nr:hypothetical protein DNFV4_00080 [Nitrospira tepida]
MNHFMDMLEQRENGIQKPVLIGSLITATP